jgi:hypothetical protein
MNYTPGHQWPQQPGATFDSSLWPTLISDGQINITGASVFDANDIYMTWDIIPQPAEESISLNFPALQGDFGGIHQVEAYTVCTPTPEPATMLLLGTGFAALAGARKLKKQLPT